MLTTTFTIMTTIDQSEKTASSKRLRESLSDEAETTTTPIRNKRRKVSPTKADSSVEYESSLSNKEKMDYSPCKRSMRAIYAKMEIMQERFAKFVPHSFDLDLETSSSNINAINDARTAGIATDIMLQKMNVLNNAMRLWSDDKGNRLHVLVPPSRPGSSRPEQRVAAHPPIADDYAAISDDEEED